MENAQFVLSRFETAGNLDHEFAAVEIRAVRVNDFGVVIQIKNFFAVAFGIKNSFAGSDILNLGSEIRFV